MVLVYEATADGGLKVSDVGRVGESCFTRPLCPVQMVPRKPLLKHIAATVNRCVPSVPCYMGAGLVRDGRHISGVATRSPDAILIDAEGYRPAIVATCHHEVWHIAERVYMDDAQLDEIDDLLSAGTSLWFNDETYLDEPEERAARAYEHFASYLECGGMITIGDDPADRLASIFHAVYSGQMATRRRAAA